MSEIESSRAGDAGDHGDSGSSGNSGLDAGDDDAEQEGEYLPSVHEEHVEDEGGIVATETDERPIRSPLPIAYT